MRYDAIVQAGTQKFATSFRTNHLSSAAVPILAPLAPVIGMCSVHPGRVAGGLLRSLPTYTVTSLGSFVE
jgi:hypothetical protein